ncbi:MAG TPA: D-aminoacyl-tRNA deacylase [Candidatus Deferrimicrobium sp.]|nr:D-aminoacyl-tRNA deacylase [Candidatus Deferrimicrobium sp.]
MPIIIVSNKDLAGQTIKQQLLEIYDFKETERQFEGNIIFEDPKTKVPIITINRRLIEADHLSEFFTTDLFIFASKHKSESERPSLLVHATGNWTNDNNFGGNPLELALTSGTVIKQALIELTRRQEETQLDYDVTSEVTHHGPTNLKSPSIFIELGSNEAAWCDSMGARVVAETILEIIRGSLPKKQLKYAIGFGGTHYANNFNKIQLKTDYAISHIAPKYVLDTVTESLVLQAINKTIEDVKYAVLDWKGMVKVQRDKLIPILSELNIEVVRIQKGFTNLI